MTGRVSVEASDEVLQLVLQYSAALDRCTQTDGANIDEVMSSFADGAVRLFIDGTGGVASQVGKDEIRASFLARSARLKQTVRVVSIDRWGDLVICRLARHDSRQREGWTHNVRVFLIKDGKIRQLVVLVDGEEMAALRREPTVTN